MSANCKGKLLDVHPFAWQASRLWVIRRTIESDSDLVTLEDLCNVTPTVDLTPILKLLTAHLTFSPKPIYSFAEEYMPGRLAYSSLHRR